MAKSAGPLLLLLGAGALLMGKRKTDTAEKTDEGLGDLPSPYGDLPDIPMPEPAPGPAPLGSPPRGDSYDPDYWGPDSESRLISIREHFVGLGYQVEVGPWPMNKLGPKGTVELTNQDGTSGKLGGGDDEKSQTVMRFQEDYNRVSRLNKADKVVEGNMGGLSVDGMVGPFTLNGLRFAFESQQGSGTKGKKWQDLVLMAKNKGISA